MAKYLNVQKQKKKKRSFGWFILGMVIYAVVFLTAAFFGLRYLWDYMEAYENARPKYALNDYMESLTDDHICDMAQSLIDQIDHNIQSEEECRAVIKETISGGVTYAKKSAECTDTRQVYVLRSGKQVIGQFAIEAQAADEYGFTPWTFAEESFDFSFLIGESVSMTAPDNYIVSANGHQLGSEYITVDNIHYEYLEEYYEEYDLPHQVTYEAGPILGELELTVADADGNPVVLSEDADESLFFHNCTAEETEKLDEFTAEYVERYVAFTGSNKNTRNGTYKELLNYVVSSSDLASRLNAALDGLQFGQSKGDEIVSITANHQVRLEEGTYLCDITYEVDTTGKKGVVRTTTNAKLIIVETRGGLKVESMNIY